MSESLPSAEQFERLFYWRITPPWRNGRYESPDIQSRFEAFCAGWRAGVRAAIRAAEEDKNAK